MIDLQALQDELNPGWRYRLKLPVRRLYTRLLLAVHGDDVRERLLTDPCLCNARHYWALGERIQLDVMAIHYNTMVDTRAALTADEVERLLN